MRKYKLMGIAAMGLAVSMAASASLIVDYTPDGTTVNSRAADSDTQTGDTWTFSESTALFLKAGAGNMEIYGGMTTTWGATQDAAPAFRQAAGGYLQVYVDTPNDTQGTSLKGMYAWRQSEFINGGDAAQVGFSSGDTLSANFSILNGASRDIRFTVKQGDTWYVSNQSKTDNTTGTYSLDPSTYTGWAVMDTSDYSWGEFSGTTFTDVQAVGLYMNYSKTDNNVQIRMDDFQVNGTVVPEPATIGMLGLGSLLTLLVRRVQRG